MEPIRILIADDHPTLRRGLHGLLSTYPDMVVVGEADSGQAIVRMVVDLAPDIVLLDVLLPGPNGVEIARELGTKAPRTKIMMLTAYDNDEYVLGALRAGACAYVLKSASEQTLVDGIRQVHEGKCLLSPSLVDKVVREFHSMGSVRAREESGLSEKDLKIVQLIAQGKTDREIAQLMFWSDRTIRRKSEDIMAKLGVRNRAQAVAEATRRGLL